MRALSAHLIVICATVYAAACGGGTSVTEVGGPDTIRCQVSLAAEPRTVGADGGAVSLSVDAARDCTWTASTDAPWATLNTTTGQGAATIGVTIAASQLSTVRTAALLVNNQRVDITQEARPCRFTLDSYVAEVGSGGGSLRVTVTTAEGCSWRTSSSAGWISASPAERTGPGSIDLGVAANAGPQRSATVTIAGQSFTVIQHGAGTAAPGPPGCTATVQPIRIDVPATPATETIRLDVAAGCAWTAVSSVPWVTIASAAAGQGAATISIGIAQNGGPARTGTVTIAAQQVTVNQAGVTAAPPACTYGIEPASRSFPGNGGEGRVEVSTRDGCQWSASSNVTWVVVTASGGTGPGEVVYRVQPNPGAQTRSAVVTIAGRPHTVVQAGTAPQCSFSLSATAGSFGAAGGEGRFRVVTSTGCEWTVSATAAWVTIVAGSGVGPGEVIYTVQTNQGLEPRTTTVVVAGQSHTITQAGAAPVCTYAIPPASQPIPASGGEGRFSVLTQAGCPWSATGGTPWLAITNGSGNGPGEVVYSVQANPVAQPRSATITVAGQTHTVTQTAAAPTCTYSLNPTSQSIPAGGGEGRFSVLTQADCRWAPSGGAPWMSIAAESGSGPGEVVYTVQANASTEARTATIVVGGQSHSITQAGTVLCTALLLPSSSTVPAAGGEGRFAVLTLPGCTWSASTAAAWVAITSGASGNGTGEVVYRAQANPAAEPRSASIVISGQATHTVNQPGTSAPPPPSP